MLENIQDGNPEWQKEAQSTGRMAECGETRWWERSPHLLPPHTRQHYKYQCIANTNCKYKYITTMIKCGIITLITSVCIETGSGCQLVDRMQLFHQCNPARLPLVHNSATLVGRNQYFRRAECTHMPGGCLCAPPGGSGLRKWGCSQVSTRS